MNIHDNQVTYSEIINLFCDKFNYKSYLELGLRDPNNTFNKIRCIEKISVDINPNCGPTFCMTTDEFFSKLDKDKKFDLIFIDASHYADNVRKDFENSLSHLNENGTIVMDDINPTQEFLLDHNWCGTAWEVFFELGKRKDLYIRTVVPSFTGFVRKGNQVTHNLSIERTFDFLEKNREVITKPITIEELKKELCYQ